jgi:uncharacterized protein
MQMQTKTIAFDQIQFKAVGDAMTFEGYASVFGGVDFYGDTIVKGAYASTLRKNGKPKMFINHASWKLPIGKWVKATEDDHGLLVQGEMTPGQSESADVWACMKHGTVDGLSIGYVLDPGDYEPLANGGRLIKKVSRLVEVSPVTFPADEAARIDAESIKSDVEGIETVRDFERFLRDAGNFSKGMTQLLVARAKVVFGGDPQSDTEAKALSEMLARINTISFPGARP